MYCPQGKPGSARAVAVRAACMQMGNRLSASGGMQAGDCLPLCGWLLAVVHVWRLSVAGAERCA